jgi:hypothetical protein
MEKLLAELLFIIIIPIMVFSNIPSAVQENDEKSLKLASMLFPDERWICKEPHLYVAKNRLYEEFHEPGKWNREMSQVRILTSRGAVAYFLPEKKNEGNFYVDTIINGDIVELKTVSGNRSTLGGDFKQGYKQGVAIMKVHPEIMGHSVFIRLLSRLSIGSVKAKIAGELKNRFDKGNFICYFEHFQELYIWTYEELRSIIGGKKSPGPT